MELYVARQPIINTRKEIFGYEILYRNGERNEFTNTDGNQATSSVINTIMQIGMDELTEGRPCFINFTENLLEYTTPTFFPPKNMVVEILETVNPTDQIIENCKKLKSKGYKIALDDFELKHGNKNFSILLELADIIKIDIRKTPREQQLSIIKNLSHHRVEFLAEKVETIQEYKQCVQDGYTYFQGYFFSKPIILSANDIPIQNHNFFLIMNELAQVEPDITKLTTLIETDISLSYKLLKLINSPLIGAIYTIKSIQQAIVFLGVKELKKWIFLLSFREMTSKREQYIEEVIKMCFIRAKVSELVALEKGMRGEASSYFLVGLLSLIDTLMRQPHEKLIGQLPLDQEIKDTILGVDTMYSDILHLSITLERAEWLQINKLTDKIGIEKHKLFAIFREAMRWTKEIMDETAVS